MNAPLNLALVALQRPHRPAVHGQAAGREAAAESRELARQEWAWRLEFLQTAQRSVEQLPDTTVSVQLVPGLYGPRARATKAGEGVPIEFARAEIDHLLNLLKQEMQAA